MSLKKLTSGYKVQDPTTYAKYFATKEKYFSGQVIVKLDVKKEMEKAPSKAASKK